ncbi:hypothetical protein BY996DRAFT_6411922 [Phakopsora pachyrhizi]|nr:hypothetical protein BY996DRAFT_6411922 [Phakopsora pachyrhizi]
MLVDFNTLVGHLPKNINDIVYIIQPISNIKIAQRMIWANPLFESLHSVTRDIIAPVKFVPQQVIIENPLSVECALAGFKAPCFSFNKNRGTILPMKGCKGNDNTIKDTAAETFKNLDDLVDKIVHILIAINMVQEHAKCQEILSTPSSSTCPKRKSSNNWRKCGALESLQIIALFIEILILKGKDFEEPYWPRTSNYILQIIKCSYLPADTKSHIPMCPSPYEIAKCIVLDFGDTWHSKVDDS